MYTSELARDTDTVSGEPVPTPAALRCGAGAYGTVLGATGAPPRAPGRRRRRARGPGRRATCKRHARRRAFSGESPSCANFNKLYLVHTSNDQDPCDTADCCSRHALEPTSEDQASCSELDFVLRGSRSASRTACTHGGHATSCSDFTPLATHRQISPPRVQPRASGSWPGAVTCLSLKQDA